MVNNKPFWQDGEGDMKAYRKAGLFLLIVFFSINISACLSLDPAKDIKSMEASGVGGENGKAVKLQYAQWSIPLALPVENALKKYNEENKDGIQVELLKIPRASYNETLNMLLSSGEGPDVFEARNEWLFSYIYKNWLYDFRSSIDDGFFDNFPEWVREYALNPKFKGFLYSVPSGQVTYRLIYNKDLFRRAGLDPLKPPATIEEMVQDAKKITAAGKGDRKYGFAIALNDIWSGLVYPMEAVNSYSGIYYFDFKSGKYDLTGYSTWLNAVRTMKEDGSLFPGETSMKEDLALVQFAEGNIGMMYAENWQPVLLKELFPANCDWAVAMPPFTEAGTKGKGFVSIKPTGWQVVNRKTKYLDKALSFWKYLYSQEYNEDMFKSGSFLPTYKGISDNHALFPAIKNWDEFLPSEYEAIYPETPLDTDEYNRGYVYLSLLNGSAPDESPLSDESNKLNLQLNKYILNNSIDPKDYTNPDFSPSNNIK